MLQAMKTTGVVTAVLLAGALTGCAGGPLTATKTATVTQLVTVTASAEAPTQPVVAGPAATIPGDGTFVIGVDIQPGVYKSPAPQSGMCSWARLKKLSGITDFDAIIKNGNNTGPGFVTIEPTDVAFATQMCDPWQKVG